MRVRGKVVALLAGGLCLAGAACGSSGGTTPAPAVPSAPPGWTLTWFDEFDGAGLPDASKWGYEVGFVRNKELQYYTRARLENARLEGGMLVIESRKEPYETAAYTSASLHTKGKGEFLYGRIEVRAKLPTGRGMWPAIWMLGVNIDQLGWPTCGEIDIMENVGFDPNRIFGTVHTQAYNHVAGTAKGADLAVAAPWESFHVYAIEWSTTEIAFFVDEQRYFTFPNESQGSAKWPFDRPHYLILNIAVGGSWGGQKGVDDAIFPQRFYIDYVRVLRRGA
jgi:beta-glucanase (GH16 family)